MIYIYFLRQLIEILVCFVTIKIILLFNALMCWWYSRILINRNQLFTMMTIQIPRSKTSRRRCYLCKQRTQWFCLKCRFFFCFTPNDQNSEFCCKTEKKDTNEITKIYRNTCFHKGHPKAIEFHFGMKQDDIGYNRVVTWLY